MSARGHAIAPLDVTDASRSHDAPPPGAEPGL